MSSRTPKSTNRGDRPGLLGGALSGVTRRGLIEAAVVAAVGTIASRPGLAQEGDSLPPSIPEWQLEPGEETLSHPYGQPSKFEADVVRRYRQGLPPPPSRLTSFSLTPLQDSWGIVTPTGLFFERHHADTPMIDPSEHLLFVHGLVERPRNLHHGATSRASLDLARPFSRMFRQHRELGRAQTPS